MKKLLLFISFNLVLLAHPVSYTIKLDIKYDSLLKEATVMCESSSKNKCGLYSIKLLDENEEVLGKKRFPFLKKTTKVNSQLKPHKMIFFLRKVPDHTYIKIFED